MALIKKAQFFEREISGTCGNEPFSLMVKFKILGKSAQTKINNLLMASYRTAKQNQGSEDPAIMLDLKDIDGEPLSSIDTKVAKMVVAGWKDFVDENENPIEFSQQNLEELVDQDGVGEAIIEGYMKGYAELKAKNLQTTQSGFADPPKEEECKE